MDNPCVKDCEGRTAVCHGTCEKYAAFAKWREEERAKRQERAKHKISMERDQWRRRAARRYYESAKDK